MSGRKFKTIFFIILIISIFLSACGNRGYNKSESAQDENKINIVTSFYPMYISAINITKDIENVEVKNLTQPQTGCLHDYALKPDDLKTLEKTDILIVNGAGMETFIYKAVKQKPDMTVIEASKGIELIKDGDEENPHVWVSVSKAIEQVRNIADELSKADPANAQKYKENANIYIEKLEALKTEMHKELDNLRNKKIITFHEAFPYFAEEFGLEIAAVIEREPGTESSPKELEEIIDTVKKQNIKALFAEPQYSAKAANTIASETGAKVYTLDPIVTGESDKDSYDDYINKMRENAKTLKEALK